LPETAQNLPFNLVKPFRLQQLDNDIESKKVPEPVHVRSGQERQEGINKARQDYFRKLIASIFIV
jgi:hypothetical protein